MNRGGQAKSRIIRRNFPAVKPFAKIAAARQGRSPTGPVDNGPKSNLEPIRTRSDDTGVHSVATGTHLDATRTCREATGTYVSGYKCLIYRLLIFPDPHFSRNFRRIRAGSSEFSAPWTIRLSNIDCRTYIKPARRATTSPPYIHGVFKTPPLKTLKRGRFSETKMDGQTRGIGLTRWLAVTRSDEKNLSLFPDFRAPPNPGWCLPDGPSTSEPAWGIPRSDGLLLCGPRQTATRKRPAAAGSSSDTATRVSWPRT